jgi:organic radical activating enzyme
VGKKLTVLKKRSKYSVHSIFRTIQGEGYHRGRAAVFVRFSGCNVWDGLEEHRVRDSENSSCALICDTKFAGIDTEQGGGVFNENELCGRIAALVPASSSDCIMVVFTGGEPGLQLTEELVQRLQIIHGVYVAAETNGTVPLPKTLDWVCLSPKPPMPINLADFDEIKVLYPTYNPLHFQPLVDMLVRTQGHRIEQWVSPTEPIQGLQEHLIRSPGGYLARAIEFVQEHPEWRLNDQGHKHWGIK